MFPSILNTFNRPIPTDRLNSPSHSALHNTVSSALGQVQAVIGVEGVNSVVGTLEYFIKSPDSDGGGHVQSAVKGGTGQTTFTKGDIFVATGPSTISKLAVGPDGQGILADSSVAAGLKWANVPGSRVFNTASVISALGAVETSIFSTTVGASVLGTTNALRSRSYISNYNYPSGASVLLRARYGGAIVASVMLRPPTGSSASFVGTIDVILFANNSDILQRGIMQVNLVSAVASPSSPVPGAITSTISGYSMNVASVNSSASQTFGLTVLKVDGGDTLTIDSTTVEKIT